MKKYTYLPLDPRAGHVDRQRVIHLLRAAAAEAGQSDARRQWIRAATQC
ncbi:MULTISPECIES: hypothetical protein [unclassified Mycobacterium]